MIRFDDIRSDPTLRSLTVGFAVAVGLGIAWMHWAGLLVGGALVSLPTKNWKRGILAGFGFGVLSLLVFAGLLVYYGSFVPALEMGRVTALMVAIPLVLGTIGGLARVLV
ncbi:hypothetical protein [Haladaptatus caseinilyticus]|uniref:hypothetical protein n=1 Tax=Haladaptatus caseinilyticus TaxID=2993314 RepID=UPI00224A99BF|nr:hypothetical protein [Haladaptatus caseinilyticus]